MKEVVKLEAYNIEQLVNLSGVKDENLEVLEDHFQVEISLRGDEMTLVGEKENLENLIKSLRLTENIKMLGYVTNLQEYQKIADVSVSCSKREGLPLNIVEAMLSGTPVVASVNRGHRELIQNGKNGFLIDVNDCERIADKVLKILTDKQLYGEIQKNANTYVNFPLLHHKNLT